MITYVYKYIYMHMQQQYKTQQLISRTNYKKHKQKLNEIKNQNHSTSLQFYNSGVGKPLDRKKILMMKLKREQIQQQNQYLRQKIEKINGIPALPARKKMYSEQQNRKRLSHSVANNGAQSRQNNRYEKMSEDKIQVDSDCGDGDNIKCVVPPNRNKIKYTSISQSKAYDYNAIIFNLSEKQKKPNSQKPYLNPIKPDTQSQNPQGHNSDSPSVACLQPNRKLTQIIRQSTNLPKDQLLYSEPQKQSHRLVLFKKTKIPYPMVSFLIEISLIDRQLLITAYGMGIFNEDFKLLLSKKKSKAILEQIRGDYEVLWNRVQVDQSGIRISGVTEQEEERDDQQVNWEDRDKSAQQRRYQITQDFLQRNYYTLLKQQKNKQQKQDKIQQTNTKKQVTPANVNSSANKPRSIFRNKIEYHKQKIESLNNDSKNQKNLKNQDKNSTNNTNRVSRNASKTQHQKEKQAIKYTTKDQQKQQHKQQNKQQHKQQNKKQNKQQHKQQHKQQNKQQKSVSNINQQQNYQQVFDQQDNEYISNNNQQQIQTQTQNNKSKRLQNNNKSKKLQKSQQQYSQNFQNNQEDIQQYSMEYESNPSKVVNNKSSINAVKKKTINNNNSAVESLVEYYAESQEQEQQSKGGTKGANENGNGKNGKDQNGKGQNGNGNNGKGQNGKSNNGKSNNGKQAKDEQVEEEYEEEFDS